MPVMSKPTKPTPPKLPKGAYRIPLAARCHGRETFAEGNQTDPHRRCPRGPTRLREAGRSVAAAGGGSEMSDGSTQGAVEADGV